MNQDSNRHDGVSGISLAVLSGILGSLAFPDRGIWPLAFFMFTPLLFTLCRQQDWKAAFRRGWFAGAVLHFGCYYWVYHTMISMSDLSPLWASVACFLFCCYSGLQLGLLGALVPLLVRRGGGHTLWMLPVLFAVIEYSFPHVFPWYMGNVFFEVPVLAQTADLMGVHGNSMILIVSSLLCLQLWNGLRGEAVQIRKVIAGLVVMWVFVLGYGSFRMQQIDSTEVKRDFKVGLVQANITPEDKKQKGIARGSIYDKGKECMEGLDHLDLDLIVWPEGGYPYYFPTELLSEKSREQNLKGKGYAGKIQRLVKERGIPFAFGALTKPEDGGKLRNSFVYLSEDGSFEQVYYKRILVPFGEYIPFSDWFPFVKGKVKGIGDMEPGTERVLFEVDGVSVLPSICYEAIYPNATRIAAMEDPKADVILNITNDMWFGQTSALDMHLMVQVSRAIELRLPLVRSTNSGITVFVDAGGRITLRTPRYEAVSVSETVLIKDLFSLYAIAGDIPLFALFALMLILCLKQPQAIRNKVSTEPVTLPESGSA